MVAAEHNLHPEYVGIDEIYAKQREQVELFLGWAAQHDWHAFHVNHYDWWTFPIDMPSQFGFNFTVFPGDIEALKSKPDFVRNLAEAARLLLLSWGWDAERQQLVTHPEPGQAWADWPIRWSKCTTSLKLFGLTELHASSLMFGQLLLDRSVSFEYRGRDLAAEHGLNSQRW